MPELILTDDHHYFLDGKPLDGVSYILEVSGLQPDMKWIDVWYKEKGIAVHRACELFDRGTLDFESVDPRIVGYLRSWEKYRLKYPGYASYLEEKLFDPIYHYAGKIDRSDCDIKSGAQMKHHRYQIAAYNNLARVNGLKQSPDRCVYLQEDGSDPFVKIHSRRDLKDSLETFLCALRVVRSRKEDGTI